LGLDTQINIFLKKNTGFEISFDIFALNKPKYIKNMKNIFILLILPVCMMVTGCKKTPLACISADKAEVIIGETVTFGSCASDSEKTLWDFGDGITAEGETASHEFSKEGVFLVTATSFSKKDKKWDKASVLITVKNRHLSKIVLKGFPAKKMSGSDWDASGFGSTIEPEVFVSLKLAASSEWQLETFSLPSAIPGNLPHTWDYSPQNVLLTNADWKIELKDDDRVGGVGGTEVMATWTVNLATAAAIGNIITLTNTSNISGNAVIELHFH